MGYFLRQLVLTITVGVLPATLCGAAVLNWSGTAGEDWGTPALWSGGAVPTPADSVWFNTDSTRCRITSDDHITLQEYTNP